MSAARVAANSTDCRCRSAWRHLEPTRSSEQRKRRPVVIVSPDDFNQATNLPVIAPITNSGDFARRLGIAVLLDGIQTTGVVRCDQPRVLDLNARNGRRVESLPSAIMDEVFAKVATIFY
ncbi:mRNA interferase (plasmid) [Aureimonas sp. SA4125]|uniref:type II toxin-antitoxin system PemK/MazF family toxin n=1 Tax=Aureimonas sp. SA4125 TaxID=2826993 RepID=UPI001CC7F81A|nr:type II toxin-antitoxin system PemK/MazF family toxin [Aureimonas sp. SA4125]BDA87234.1 mRNA interferase [Aureimonas sp. SA4125]